MNSIIASAINGTVSNGKLSISQQVANGSHSSLLNSSIDFQVTGTKQSSSTSCQGKYLVSLNSNEPVLNGLKKSKIGTDYNQVAFNNSYLSTNGNNDSKQNTEDGISVPKVQLYTGKIHVEWKHVHKIGAGLNNLGNTCFMNTVIQSLTYCPPLANYLLHDNDHSAKCNIQGFCMMCLLQNHMKRSIGKTGEIVKPVDIYQRLKLIAKHFQFGRQEDAHEYLRYVIDNLWKSSLSQNNNSSKLDAASKETTVINQIFGGYHRSQVTCMRCKEKSNTFDHFMDFILDIKQNVMSLEKALEKFTHPEMLDEENSYKCPKCKIKVTAQKKFTVYKAPNVATFQLKRFDYNRTFGGKITKLISYPQKLNLRPYMSEPKGEPVWYRLNAVIVHSGPSCNSGHYYCYVKNSNGIWYIMDDQRVHQVSLTQVMNQSAYVLFYIKSENEAPPFKKCFDNRNSLVKVNSPASNHKKTTENTPLKSALTERNQTKQPSPLLKPLVSSSLIINKKVVQPQKEKISSEIRSSMPNINEFYKTVGVSSPKKSVQPQGTSKMGNGRSRLVPYSRDSSESSDENENRVSTSNPDNISGKPLEHDSVKFKSKLSVSQNVSNGVPKLEIKRKMSKSSMTAGRGHSLSSNDSARSRVVATSSWTVTDAAPVSPSMGSSCSTNSVNSTTDWLVTDTTIDSPRKSPEDSHKKNGHSVLPVESGTMDSSSKPDVASASSFCDSSKNCDFRVKHPENEQPFLGSEKNSNSSPSGSFLKRKSCSVQQETSGKSTFRLTDYRSNSMSKKTKLSEESRCSDSENAMNDKISYNGSKQHTFPKSNEAKHSINPIKVDSKPNQMKKFSENSKKSSKFENNKNKNPSQFSSSDSDSEYDWVEKTKDSIESHTSPQKDKQGRNNSTSSDKHYQQNRKYDVASELKSNSKYFYGASVATWNGESSYSSSSYSNGEKRKYLDSYEDEYDRGKIRKFKSKDHFYHDYRNPFQKHGERNYNHTKYSKYDYGHHQNRYKPYDTHHHWKRNQQHDYHRNNRKIFRPFFRR